MRNIRIGATGEVKTPSWGSCLVRESLLELRASRHFNVVEVTSGAAYGIDTLFFEEALELFPNATHRIVYPIGAWHNQHLVAQQRRNGLALVRGYTGHTPAEAYMRRNDAIVRNTDLLFAYPQSQQEQQRSGTWATVRRGRKAACEIRHYPLDRSEPFGWPADWKTP